jgi:hypothetical protein
VQGGEQLGAGPTRIGNQPLARNIRPTELEERVAEVNPKERVWRGVELKLGAGILTELKETDPTDGNQWSDFKRCELRKSIWWVSWISYR